MCHRTTYKENVAIDFVLDLISNYVYYVTLQYYYT